MTYQKPTKAQRLRELMRSGRWADALKLANSFGRLGEHEKAIRDGHLGATNPTFCRAVHKDPDLMVQLGVEALLARYVPEKTGEP